jgi:peptidyl-tRNA hydrolase
MSHYRVTRLLTKSTQKERPRPVNSSLAILHDELEALLGQLKVKNGNSSATGYNGIKSVLASLQGAGLLDQLGHNFIGLVSVSASAGLSVRKAYWQRKQTQFGEAER